MAVGTILLFLFFAFLLTIPFLVAYRNRKTHPVVSKLLIVVWGILYMIIIVAFIVEYA